jgi:hypothetical protein
LSGILYDARSLENPDPVKKKINLGNRKLGKFFVR